MASLVVFLLMGAPFAVVVFKLQALTSTRLQFFGAICILLPFLIISQNSVFMWLPLALLMAAIGTRCNALKINNTWRLVMTCLPAIALLATPYFLIKGGVGLAKIFLLSAEGDYEGVRKLLADGVDANLIDNKGATPLFYAARNGRTDVINLLLEHGANPATQLQSGSTAEDIAASHNQYKAAEVLRQFSHKKANHSASIFQAN
jgi:hypothetical protein